ncbi:hypothetical protein [Allosphingosinicella deserti]|uniref:Uncharacterized protein n=1 Tax=Allosphingosinicella deserti TaxID=2116704 RepID=A0A2P7QNE2_9SPHN|nr:hypothetical protein [Sphingomonas deserti]PSJ39460.1 hypothetical protein C7I55_12670 [Sphingomonas deserti]
MTGQRNIARGGINWRLIGWTVAAALLLMPVLAMQATPEVAWGPGDFAAFALVLGGAGLACEFLMRKAANPSYRAASCVAAGAGLLLLWANAAIGLIGSEGENANLLYFGVLAIAVVGAAIGGFRARRMVHACVAAALGQAAVPVIALSAGWASVEMVGSADVLMVSGGFIALWLVAAALFRKAAQSAQ